MFFNELPDHALFVLLSEHESDFPDDAHLYQRSGTRTATIGPGGRMVIVREDAHVLLVLSEHHDKRTTFFVPDGKRRIPVLSQESAAHIVRDSEIVVSDESYTHAKEIHL